MIKTVTNDSNHIEDYKLKVKQYEVLGEKVHIIIRENLEMKGLKPHAILFRAKQVDSFERKIKKKNYTDPLNEITDLCGIRIICYVEDEVNDVCEVIKELFNIDSSKSVNKNEELGEDRVGYKSVHLICQISQERLVLPEFKKFKDLYFEIQVRTILQHSWAEIEHDKNYKFSGVLPKEIKRRLMLLSGTLELVDREFNQLSKEIDNYATEVNEQTKKGDLDIEIDSVSLIQYLSVKFADLVKAGTVPSLANEDDELLGEMRGFKLYTLNDVERIIPPDLSKVIFEQGYEIPFNFLGLMRDIMMIYDSERFFKDGYKGRWIMPDFMTQLLRHYGVDVTSLPVYESDDYSYD